VVFIDTPAPMVAVGKSLEFCPIYASNNILSNRWTALLTTLLVLPALSGVEGSGVEGSSAEGESRAFAEKSDLIS
jgi:hypothetical protein